MYAFLSVRKSVIIKSRSVIRSGCLCQRENCLSKFASTRSVDAYTGIPRPHISSRPLLRTWDHRAKIPNVHNIHFCHSLVRVSSVVCVNEDSLLQIRNSEHNNVLYGSLDGRRHFYLTRIVFEKEPLKPSSKVEETVNKIVEDLEESKKKEGPAVPEKPPPKKEKTSLWTKVKDEVKHYYHGFRLLIIDTRVAFKLVWRILRGKSLSRREHRQLVRTVSDIFRLLPFSIFIIVPFMELLLPVALKLFPQMLPSTFETANERDNKIKKELKVKLEMATFLQKTLDDMAVQAADTHKHSESAKEFAAFIDKIRESGERATNEEILKFSKLFEDEITLDSLSRQQLTALCRVLEIQPLGTNNFLRFQLKMKLRSLYTDDKVIQKEGVDSLTLAELQQACRARGMRSLGMPEARLRLQLQQWLDLHLNEHVPTSLLLLSRALYLPDNIPASDQLQATISSLPDTAATQAKAMIHEREGLVDNKTKLEIIKEEERKIKEERREEKREEEEKKVKAAEEILEDKAPILQDTTGIKPTVELEKPVAEAKPEEEELSSTDVRAIEEALSNISKEKRKLLLEKEALDDLKEELADYQEDLADLQQVLKLAGKAQTDVKDVKETTAAKRLFKKVNRMIGSMDSLLNKLQTEEKQMKKHLETEGTDKKQEDLVSIEELIKGIKEIQKTPDDSRLDRIADVLIKFDSDRDGALRVEDVLKVIELIGKENVKLSAKQIDEIVAMMEKEEILELEDQIGKVLEKERRRHIEKEKEKPGEDQQKDTAKEPLKSKVGAKKQHEAEEGKKSVP